MAEVYAGTKPGRPSVALVISAVALVGMLGLAWFQVLDSRALGPEQRVDGTPLWVRPPKDWIHDRKRPGSFAPPVRRAFRGRGKWEIDRRIRFAYERLPTFQSPVEWLSERVSGTLRPERARIGRFDAVQVRPVVRRLWGRQRVARESILRVACLPGGHVISVMYLPMTDLTVADLKLFDKVCDVVRIDEPTLMATREEALRQVGVDFPLEDDWQAGLPRLPEVPGLLVVGAADGLPAWSLGVFRTWLAAGREPGDLVLDFAATAWLLAEEDVAVREWKRADGARIATVRHPYPARNWHSVASAWVVAESPSRAVIFFVYASKRHVAAADEAVQGIVEQIAIAPIEAVPEIRRTEAAGRALAAKLTQKGALPWWGRQPLRLVYRGTTGHGDELMVVDRAARRGGPARGYEGRMRRRIENKQRDEDTAWKIDGHAVGYEYESKTYAGDVITIVTSERRSSGADVVHREVMLNDLEWWSGTFRPGPAFVCPPVELIAEAWVARQPAGSWIIEVATLLGRGAHTRLLRPLPPDDGPPRALLLDDYHPFGTILEFDEQGELRYRIDPAARYERAR